MFEDRNDAHQYYIFFSKADASGEIHPDHVNDSHRKVVPMFKGFKPIHIHHEAK